MSYRRVVLRNQNAENLSDSEQKQFVDDVASRLDGTNIGGYFITCKGGNWLEWEGDYDTVDEKIQEHLEDDRVGDYDVIEDEEIQSRNVDKWWGHCAPCARQTNS